MEVRLYRQDQDVVLEVRDDGRGFEVPAATGSAEAIGLYSMRYRAHAIQAVLQIDAPPGGDTRVCCAVPSG